MNAVGAVAFASLHPDLVWSQVCCCRIANTQTQTSVLLQRIYLGMARRATPSQRGWETSHGQGTAQPQTGGLNPLAYLLKSKSLQRCPGRGRRISHPAHVNRTWLLMCHVLCTSLTGNTWAAVGEERMQLLRVSDGSSSPVLRVSVQERLFGLLKPRKSL